MGEGGLVEMIGHSVVAGFWGKRRGSKIQKKRQGRRGERKVGQKIV
jgi:hypothetical protein